MNETDNAKHWFIYGHEQPKEQLAKMLAGGTPPWRDFSNPTRHDAYKFQIGEAEKQVINAAIYLRRPLLVTGDPGTGKSSLAYSIAKELQLGKVLVWPITSRSTIQDVLYRYDAIGRLHEANLGHLKADDEKSVPPIEKYLTLGPLGTAFADSEKSPRVLLIDEIDKCDIDLPNDLLYLFEEGQFEIPELSRLVNTSTEQETGNKFKIRKYNADSPEDIVTIENGQVHCQQFPIVIMTSNGERELPAPFLRRCLRLTMKSPNEEILKEIVAAHFETEMPSLERFIQHVIRTREQGGLVATDQLMNAIYLAQKIILSNNAADDGNKLSPVEEELVENIVMESINRIR